MEVQIEDWKLQKFWYITQKMKQMVDDIIKGGE